jgi:hypothetical protein
MHKKRRGRPRREGVNRTASGRISEVQPADLGTVESRRNRSWLINGSDPALAGSAIGVLLANGIITGEQLRAAGRYSWARAGCCFGSSRPTGCFSLIDLSRRGAEPSDLASQAARRNFEKMVSLLSPAEKRAVDQLVIDNTLPRWFVRAKLRLSPRLADEAEHDALLEGLNRLAEA